MALLMATAKIPQRVHLVGVGGAHMSAIARPMFWPAPVMIETLSASRGTGGGRVAGMSWLLRRAWADRVAGGGGVTVVGGVATDATRAVSCACASWTSPATSG